MGRKLDPTNKVKRGPGRKARKQKGAETELANFLVDGKIHDTLYCALFPHISYGSIMSVTNVSFFR